MNMTVNKDVNVMSKRKHEHNLNTTHVPEIENIVTQVAQIVVLNSGKRNN